MTPTLGNHATWWIEARCGCKLVQIPVRMILKDFRPSTSAADYAARLRCRDCGARPECSLVDDIQSGASGNPSARQAVRIDL